MSRRPGRRAVSRLFAVVAASLGLVLALAPPATAQDGTPPGETGAEPQLDAVDLPPQAADPDDVAPQGTEGDVTAAASTVRIEGRGWGHGRGLGQFGALGYAVEFGWSYSTILDHYYGSTSKGSVPTRDVLVHLTAFDGQPLDVTSGAAFKVGPHDFAPGQVARVELSGTANFRVFRDGVDLGVVTGVSNGSRGSGTNLPVVSTVADPGDDPTKMLQLGRAGANRRAYRGQVQMLNLGGGAFTANLLNVESYLRGVVPRESPASWGDLGGGRGVEALKAQAVAARSYALRLAANRANFFVTDTCDTVACQVYGGAALQAAGGAWAPLDYATASTPWYGKSAAAVAATAGEVRLKGDGSIALTEFSSSTGGYTAEAVWTTPDGVHHPNNPFGAVPDAGDSVSANPNHHWGSDPSRPVNLDANAIIARAEASSGKELGSFQSVAVTQRNGLGSEGGRVREITVKGTAGTAVLRIPNWSGDSFRKAFGLKSDWYSFPAYDPKAPDGFWVARTDGAVAAFGSAGDYGDLVDLGIRPNGPIVDMAAHPSGGGYWLLGRDGGVFSFGAAGFYGSTGSIKLNQPVVGMAAHPSGQGYWFVAADGGIFAYGKAQFFGSMAGIPLVSPIVGMASTPSGKGYWLVAADGGIFAFGDAQFFGSIGGKRLNEPIVGMAVHPSGNGYWFVASDGGVFSYQASGFHGAATNKNRSAPIVDMAASAEGDGYWLLQRDSLSYSFDVSDFPSSQFGKNGAPAAVAIETRPG